MLAPTHRQTSRRMPSASARISQMLLSGAVGVAFGLYASTVWAADVGVASVAQAALDGGCDALLTTVSDGVRIVWSGPHEAHGSACPAFKGVGFAFLMIAALVVLGVARMRLNVEQRRLDLARTLLEQGKEPPAELLRGTHAGDLRKGIVLIFAGLGMVLTAAVTSHHGLMSGGLIPGFIGMGYLVSYRMGLRGGGGSG